MKTHRRHLLLPIGIASAVALGSASAAVADRGTYLARSFTEPATGGLAVSGHLSTHRAVSRARVIVPEEWRRLSAKAGQLRFLTPGGSCRYRVTFTVRTRLDERRDAAALVAEGLPAAGSRYILDSGERGSSAFRVIREKTTGSQVRLSALRAAVLTRRSDIVPAGQTAWSELRVTATERAGDECHSGSYRQRVGPQLGDALATARTTLAFVRKPS